MEKQIKNKKIFGGLYVAPAMFLMLALLIIPLIYTIYCSFYQYKYLMKGNFVGFDNYIYCLTNEKILNAFVTTIGITFIATAISIIGGLLMALWIEKRSGLFAYLIEMIGLIPWVISMVVAGLLWRWLFNGDLGLFNVLLKWLGIESSPDSCVKCYTMFLPFLLIKIDVFS